LLYSVALKSLASAVILAHNHPSGNLQPSNADIELTNNFKKAGELLNINLLDHLIISTDSYYSFADKGML
jgi:DNA repair protein RadC